ncbi:WD repeat-containing protein, partial [Reticulomyxa filosa]
MNKPKQSNNCNQWFPSTDSNNYPIHIGRENDNHYGVRALIGGSNNHLLFIAYKPKKISVFNLNTLEFIRDDILLAMDKIVLGYLIKKSAKYISLVDVMIKLFHQIVKSNLSPDGKFIVSCSNDNTIRIWNIKTGKEWKTLKGCSTYVYDVKYFPSSQTIVSCSSDNMVQLWNIKSGKEIQRFEGYSYFMMCVDVSQNNNTIAPANFIHSFFFGKHVLFFLCEKAIYSL